MASLNVIVIAIKIVTSLAVSRFPDSQCAEPQCCSQNPSVIHSSPHSGIWTSKGKQGVQEKWKEASSRCPASEEAASREGKGELRPGGSGQV